MKPTMSMYATITDFKQALAEWEDDHDINPEDPDEEFYDANGNVDSSGIYDAGGHVVRPEVAVAQAEYLNEQDR